MPQAPDELEGFQRLLSKLLPYAVGFFVFIVPIVRAIREARKQQAATRRGKAAGEDADQTPPASGREAWEDLLRGRGAARTQAPPVPPVSRVPLQPRIEPRDFDEEPSLEDAPPPPLVELPTELPSRSETFAADETLDESRAEELEGARERAESARQVQVAESEYEASSPYRSAVAPTPASAIAPDSAVARPVRWQSESERRLFPDAESAVDRRTALRRAILLREVLGPPVALGGGPRT